MRRVLLGVLLAAAAVHAQSLTEVKRICVAPLQGGETASAMRDMLIAALQKTGAFAITENPDRADAILKGTAEDLVYTEQFSSEDGVSARASMGSLARATGSRTTPSVTLSERESRRSTERKHEAFAAVRLVNKDGDVIWSTTQESLGAKFRGASADVAEKVTKQLLADLAKAKSRL